MNTSEKQQQLIDKLKELFMMDQADLDFGIYRVMNAKHDEIDHFLHQDLLPQIRGVLQAGGKASTLQNKLEEAIKNAQDLGVDPDAVPKVQELKQLLGDGATNSLEKDETEIFSHLYTFFSRYYDGGDFMSLRRYKQETYSPLPMNGEEVKLHWANADQYYIKSAENFSHYTFKIGVSENEDNQKRPIRFELVAASTEQNNNKADSDKDRRFILDKNNPVAIRETDGVEELVIHFSYQPDSKKRKQKDLNMAAIAFLSELQTDNALLQAINGWTEWQTALLQPAPTEKNKKRTLLEKHLTDYTAKNSFDYFIHKDLGGFLKRELDFFIKNELLLLDDIVPNSVDQLSSQLLSNERALKKIIAFKSIALKIIAFLAQLEDFQKKLWLKKKFVLDTQYCMTLDRVPETFYSEIAENPKQIQEWVDLGFTTENTENTENTESTKVTESFLKENPYLLMDTGLFDEGFKLRLLAEIEDLDETTDGLLVHSENFQALNLIHERYQEKVKCIYIDPPYNTGNDGFIYKDGYSHSTWLSMLHDRLLSLYKVLDKKGVLWCSLDENEAHRYRALLDIIVSDNVQVKEAVWQHSIQTKGYAGGMALGHNSIFCLPKSSDFQLGTLDRTKENNASYSNPDNDPKGAWRTGYLVNSLYRPNLIYPVKTPCGNLIEPPETGWRYSKETMNKKISTGEIFFSDDETRIIRKIYLVDQDGHVPNSLWLGKDWGTSRNGNLSLKHLFGNKTFNTVKPTELISRLEKISGDSHSLILDSYAGSGTTAHSTININRNDNGKRKYILVEMGVYFDTVVVPRIKKVVYAERWKDGKPVANEDGNYNGISHCFKTLRLESYEDVLDNLHLQRTEQQADILNNPKRKSVKEDYFLNYMLNVEAKGSLFSPDLFIDPFNAKIRVTRDNESKEQSLDLVETFNYLLGLRVETTRKQQGIIEVIGKNPANQNVHIIWRNLTQTDNDALDNWFRKQSYNTRDMEFDLVYVNGDNNLPNLKTGEENWKVQLIEEVFQTLMFAVEEI